MLGTWQPGRAPGQMCYNGKRILSRCGEQSAQFRFFCSEFTPKALQVAVSNCELQQVLRLQEEMERQCRAEAAASNEACLCSRSAFKRTASESFRKQQKKCNHAQLRQRCEYPCISEL
eukprot:1464177-Amphidinium_carterae.1